MGTTAHGDEEYDNLINLIMKIAKLVCIWPLERDHPTSSGLFRTCHLFGILFTIVSIVTSQLADIIYNLDDLNELTECALLLCTTILSVIRLVVFSFHQKDMLYAVETMREDWVRSSYEERTILREKCFFTFRLSRCFTMMVLGNLLFFSFRPILETYFLGAKKIFPFRGYFFADQTISPIYECLYVFNGIGSWFAGGTIIGATTFNLIAITHGSAKFAILRKKLEAMSKNDPNVDRIMADCVKRHQDAIIFADTLERIINVLALGQFVISTGLLCFAGFQITSMMEDKTYLMRYSVYLSAAILELFMFSFSGNRLIDESNAVGESAYRSDWIGGTFGRNLQIVMMRSKIPSAITAAKFYSLSYESFSQVLSTSFSFMIVLLAVNEE